MVLAQGGAFWSEPCCHGQELLASSHTVVQFQYLGLVLDLWKGLDVQVPQRAACKVTECMQVCCIALVPAC